MTGKVKPDPAPLQLGEPGLDFGDDDIHPLYSLPDDFQL